MKLSVDLRCHAIRIATVGQMYFQLGHRTNVILAANALNEVEMGKVSALYGRLKTQPAPRDIEFYRPVLDLTFDCFRPDRRLYRSDWPVAETSGDYASVLALTEAYFDAKGHDVSAKVFHTNAVRFLRDSLNWQPIGIRVVYEIRLGQAATQCVMRSRILQRLTQPIALRKNTAA